MTLTCGQEQSQYSSIYSEKETKEIKMCRQGGELWVVFLMITSVGVFPSKHLGLFEAADQSYTI